MSKGEVHSICTLHAHYYTELLPVRASGEFISQKKCLPGTWKSTASVIHRHVGGSLTLHAVACKCHKNRISLCITAVNSLWPRLHLLQTDTQRCGGKK